VSNKVKKILVATTNPGKIAEIRAMLDFDVEWLGLSDFPNINEVKEDGLTFAENARKKALGYAKATGLWTIADDSGLVIDALDGAPGVKSARFSDEQSRDSNGAGRNRTLLDHKNMAKVLKLLESVPEKKRAARFVCCLCLASPPDEPAKRTAGKRRASPEKILIETEGTLEGLIAERETGENGFGYDPIFFVPSLNKTVAQLTRKEKNAISHRGSAIRKLKPLLDKLLHTA
jgi:XTP/dITP diphosphohydrolase